MIPNNNDKITQGLQKGLLKMVPNNIQKTSKSVAPDFENSSNHHCTISNGFFTKLHEIRKSNRKWLTSRNETTTYYTISSRTQEKRNKNDTKTNLKRQSQRSKGSNLFGGSEVQLRASRRKQIAEPLWRFYQKETTIISKHIQIYPKYTGYTR